VPQYKKDNNQNQILGDIENLKDSLDMNLYLEKVKLVFDCIRLEGYEKARTIFSSFLKNIYSLGAYEAENRLVSFFDMLIDKINEYFMAIHIVKEKILILEPFKIEEFEITGMLMLDKLIQGCQAQNKVPDKEIITKALNYIEKNFSNDISLDDVANYVFLSSSYFSRVFKQCVGESFTDYIINLKMKKAAEYLANKKYKVYEISEMVGYSSSKHFIKMFKVYSGYTPKEYRLKMLNIEE
jgi:two-component system response regulator YesN